MSQSESESLTVDPRAENTIKTVEQEFRFPAFWYGSAGRAREAIRHAEDTHAPNYEKADIFKRELNLLCDHLCDYSRELFSRLTEAANASGIDGDWAEEQTRAETARIRNRSLDLRQFGWPDEIAAKHNNDLTCWIIVACSRRPVVRLSRPVIRRTRTFDYPEGPGWLAPWLPASAAIFPEPEAFSPEATEAIIAEIEQWLSAEIEKAIQIAKLEQPRLAQVTEEFKLINEDYTKVRLRSEEFILTNRQGQIVKVLHEEYQKGLDRTLSLTGIKAKLTGSKIKKMEHAFRSLKNRGQDWKELIDSPSSGRYRLNI